MAFEPVGLRAHFSLDSVAHLLHDFQPPAGEFAPAERYRLRYRLHTLTGMNDPAGALELEREPLAGGRFRLNMTYTKPMMPPAYQQEVRAAMVCRQDQLATPESWDVETRTVSHEGKTVPVLNHGITGRIEKGQAVVETLGTRRARPVEGPCTLNWALFEAIQRLPRGHFGPLAFTVIDHFDYPKAGQELRYRGAIEVPLGGEPVQSERTIDLEKGSVVNTYWRREGARDTTLHGYEHLGPGAVPWIYWTDAQGRVLFVISGIEAYLLDTSAG